MALVVALYVAWPRAPHVQAGHPIVGAGHVLEQVRFDDLPGIDGDNLAAALDTFRRSCANDRRERPESLVEVCVRALALAENADAQAVRDFFVDAFQPWRIEPADGDEGLVTAYYEPVVAGSRERTARFSTPLYALPAGLVPVTSENRPEGWDENLSWGFRTEDGLRPFFTRAEIGAGDSDVELRPIAFVEDDVEAFYIHIQGSTRIALSDGTTMRVGFAGKNGWPYTSVGRYMQDNGIRPDGGFSMDAMRRFFRQDMDRARDLMAQNRSYIFFREIGNLDPTLGPIGGEGIPLTAGRSIAVDTAFHRYGTPLYIDAVIQSGPDHAEEPFRRMMVAQDTGSAIKGPARADLFWGTGPEAGSIAGGIKAPGTFYVLLPKQGGPGY